MLLALLLRMYAWSMLFWRRRDGATAIEYVILIVVIALVVLAAGKLLGPQIATFFGKVGDALT
ncbi:Flp family type IVb pilin [Pseudomonas sp. WS 5059]|jgi:pilus assembly protein Flp/PilA|uniref:Flp family type IVb pilin n=1 Tax=unclassified Pseudomonas TaxID=196821 RepID=UPI001475FC10|nr:MULTISPECIES: Flp family type IVb pilin [unclassified Pseudomonas]NMX62250.1 Flp family type IVb pilin [Pseudomonas sp. WS 5079]NMX66357.1 Flp family type IVb pilin [Pseudomonas sp. WS 5111]NMX87903.1 Flp family type IVb pilin [Pseudomonas sp. WS 5010]NMY04265.1 Flp family type IVb pilin [Pseudomonas sp. WS 5059]NMY29620.1 Flp family type IVb pilin [Pseudomonas sp. WS 5021]